MKTIARSLLTISLCSLTFAAHAAPSPNIDQMRKQLAELQKAYEEQVRIIHAMEARLQQTEKTMQALSDSNQPVKVAQNTQQVATTETANSAPVQRVVATNTKEEVVREAPPSRSAEAVYQEQHTLFDRRFTLETGLTYSHYDRKQLSLNGFLALDAIFLGNINVDTVKADIWTLDLTGRYTLNDRMQFDLNAPFLYRDTTYISAGQGYASTAYSEKNLSMGPKLGDVNAGLYYQLLKETPNRPDVVWNLRVKGPTGSNPYGIKVETVPGNTNLIVPTELPSGNGVWAASTGLSFVKTLDPAIVFASVNYFHNFSHHFDDISTDAATVVPGDIKLGDSFQYGLGTAFALNERMSLSLSYTQRFTARSKLKPDGQDWTTIVGSDANAAMLNFGATYGLSDNSLVVANVGAGLTPDAPNATVGVKYVKSY